MNLNDKINLKKRALIELVNDILITVFDIEHTRHRSPINAPKVGKIAQMGRVKLLIGEHLE